MTLERIEELIEKIKIELKAKFNKEANRYGCEINNVNIELFGVEKNEYILKQNIQATAKKNRTVTDYKMHKSNKLVESFFWGTIIICFLIVIINSYLYLNTNNLMFYFISLLLKSIPELIFCFGISFVICAILIKARDTVIIKSLILTIITTFILGAFGVFDNWISMPSSTILKYNYIKVENNKTSLLYFKYNVLKDVIRKQTETITVKSSDILAVIMRNSGYITYKIFTPNNQICTYSSEYSDDIIYIIKDLKRLEEEMIIEYYKNSGVIKCIDGIELFDYEQFENRIESLKIQNYDKILIEK